MNKKGKTSKNKNPHPTTLSKKQTKKPGRWKEVYYNYRSWRQTPADNDYLEETGKKLVMFALENRDDPKHRKRTLERFYEESGIPAHTFDDWRKRSSFLESCVQYAKMIFGNRLEEGALFKELSEKMALWQLHHYLPRWDEINKYQQSLREDKEGKGGPVEIVVKRLGSDESQNKSP